MRPATPLLALLLVAAAAPQAAAGPEEAKAHYKRGLSFYALEKYADAAAEYEAAFEAEPDPALLYNAAQAHRLAGNKTRALALYQNYLRLFPAQPNRAEVNRHIDALKAAIESDSHAQQSPPTAPLTPDPEIKPPPRTPPPETTPETTPPAAKPPAADLSARKAAPEKKRTPKWVWGVVGGIGGAAVIGLALGLGFGLSDPGYPTPGIGTARVQ